MFCAEISAIAVCRAMVFFCPYGAGDTSERIAFQLNQAAKNDEDLFWLKLKMSGALRKRKTEEQTKNVPNAFLKKQKKEVKTHGTK